MIEIFFMQWIRFKYSVRSCCMYRYIDCRIFDLLYSNFIYECNYVRNNVTWWHYNMNIRNFKLYITTPSDFHHSLFFMNCIDYNLGFFCELRMKFVQCQDVNLLLLFYIDVVVRENSNFISEGYICFRSIHFIKRKYNYNILTDFYWYK